MSCFECINKCLLSGNKFMPKTHLKQPEFVYSACGPSTKNKERIQKFKEPGDTKYIYRNESVKACFQQDMAYRDFRRTVSDKILKDEAFSTAKNTKYNRYQKGLILWFMNCLIKRLLVEELLFHKMNTYLKNFIKQLLEKFIKEKFIHHSKTIFGGRGVFSRYAVNK